MGPVRPSNRRVRRHALRIALVVLAGAATACETGPVVTPPIAAGASGAPREVNLIAKDYEFLPATLDLVPGETVLLHVINGGLDVHEAIIGSEAVQDAWERAEAAVAGAPPGPTPVVSVPPEVSGLRIVVESGQRVDVTWTVPSGDTGGAPPAFIVGCHIPGHWERGMQIPVRWVGAS